MVRLKHKLTQPPQPPARGVKAATFRLLLDTAMALIKVDGHVPSVAEVAARSKVSRATAYRYFPSRSALVTAVVDSSLGPVRSFASSEADGRARVQQLFVKTFPRFKEFEPQMRAAAQLALEQWALERAGLLEEEPYRRGHRIAILEHALAPLAPDMPAAVRIRLHRALSVVYGIEPYMILKDIWGLPDREVERIALWMADALIDAAQRDAAVAAAAVPKVRAVAGAKAGGGQRLVARMSERPPRPSRPRRRSPRRNGSTRSTTTAPASPSICRSSRSGPTDRPRPAPRCRPRSTSPTAATPASGSTCSRPRRRARRCWSTSTAATGARSTSATPRSSRRRSSPPAPWWW